MIRILRFGPLVSVRIEEVRLYGALRTFWGTCKRGILKGSFYPCHTGKTQRRFFCVTAHSCLWRGEWMEWTTSEMTFRWPLNMALSMPSPSLLFRCTSGLYGLLTLKRSSGWRYTILCFIGKCSRKCSACVLWAHGAWCRVTLTKWIRNVNGVWMNERGTFETFCK